MLQPSFFGQEGIAEIRQLPGASGAKLLDWLGHGYFASKKFSPQHPYTLISEWLCADIASFLGLPIPSRQIIQHDGQKWLGFEWRDDGNSFEPGMEAKLMNNDVVAGMFVFDVLVCNRDRHAGNMLLQHPSPNMDGYFLQLIDHSHALIGDLPNYDAFAIFLSTNQDPNAFLQVAPLQIRSIIHAAQNFAPWLQKVSNLTESRVRDSASRIPPEWKPTPDDTSRLLDFLIERKGKIDTLLNSGLSNFPECQ